MPRRKSSEPLLVIFLLAIIILATIISKYYIELAALLGAGIIIYGISEISRYYGKHNDEGEEALNNTIEHKKSDDEIHLESTILLIKRSKEEFTEKLLSLKDTFLPQASPLDSENYNSDQDTTITSQSKLEKLDKILDEFELNRINDIFKLLTNNRKFSTKNPAAKFTMNLSEIELPFKYLENKRMLKIADAPVLQSFANEITILDKIFILPKILKNKKTNKNYHHALNEWEKEKKRKESINLIIANKIISAKKEIYALFSERERKYTRLNSEWETLRAEFYDKKEKENAIINNLKDGYRKKQKDAIIWYCRKILEIFQFCDTFPSDVNLDFNENSKVLIVEYRLPIIDDLPNLKETKYIKSRNELKEIYLSDRELKKLYDSTIYKITLRLLYELFHLDKVDTIDSIVFNGWTNSMNRATGVRESACILTVHTTKQDFLKISLPNVDPKLCFKNIKGIACSDLSSLTPIMPIQVINKEDKRFIEGRNVSLDSYANIAAMDWNDFEHLIRELFEVEFKREGGDVRVTQASRDGGVDAILFDPDPLFGGRIVIQAKRYTNTVGVSAVRDLYGTVMNEGANKGILVTTSDYGPDSYEFAKDKPLTLINGSNLLSILEKHGHKVKIDIKEAKKIFNDSILSPKTS